jgi:DNA-binding IclR family transcriptional regulator
VASTPNGHVRSLDKAIDILSLLAAESHGLGLRELANRLGFNESTAHHLVATLRRRGFVDQDPRTKVYRLGYGLVGLVNEFLAEADVSSVGIGPIRALRDASGDTSFLTILQGRELFVVFQAPGLRPIQTGRARLPGQTILHSCASGKTLLAYLPPSEYAAFLATAPLTKFTGNTIATPEELLTELARIREQGYALDREEFLDGLACVAAPVFDRDGACLATASVAYPAIQSARRDELVRLVTATAATISTHLGYVPDGRVPARRGVVLAGRGAEPLPAVDEPRTSR